MATATGTVGSKQNLANGSQADQSFLPSGAQRTADAHGRYLDSIIRGNVFSACNQAGVALSVLSATATGFILSNPFLSGRWLALLQLGWMQTTAATTAVSSVQLAAGALSATAVTHTTPVTVVAHPFGSNGKGVGLVDSSATLPAAPTAIMSLASGSVSATATTGIPPLDILDVGGLIVLQPGTNLSLSALSGVTTVAAHMFWEEIAVPTNYV